MAQQSTVSQLSAFFGGVILYGVGSENKSDRWQRVGLIVMFLWGLTQWVFVMPMSRRLKRRGKRATLKGLHITSIIGTLPGIGLTCEENRVCPKRPEDLPDFGPSSIFDSAEICWLIARSSQGEPRQSRERMTKCCR